jgi:hypothetical protein
MYEAPIPLTGNTADTPKRMRLPMAAVRSKNLKNFKWAQFPP